MATILLVHMHTGMNVVVTPSFPFDQPAKNRPAGIFASGSDRPVVVSQVPSAGEVAASGDILSLCLTIYEVVRKFQWSELANMWKTKTPHTPLDNSSFCLLNTRYARACHPCDHVVPLSPIRYCMTITFHYCTIYDRPGEVLEPATYRDTLL